MRQGETLHATERLLRATGRRAPARHLPSPVSWQTDQKSGSRFQAERTFAWFQKKYRRLVAYVRDTGENRSQSTTQRKTICCKP